MDFDLNITPPTVTAQEHKIRVVGGRPMFYDTPKLKAARATFESLLRKHVPAEPLDGPVALTVEWRFATKTHREGTYRVTRPDTDNLQKLLKDCMTRTGFWRDDAQVCREEVTKRWSREKPGIHIRVVSIDDA
ncbi:MAG: RusA family crossover junction endodeoxyribonuclease [Clostridia bacterium]|nr:RusA family crossover junction endodeoxyribonuclease [Clostridia bacterium]